MGIKWLGKSHRSPVSYKEISREQVANRLQSRCKQGLRYQYNEIKSLFIIRIGHNLYINDLIAKINSLDRGIDIDVYLFMLMMF